MVYGLLQCHEDLLYKKKHFPCLLLDELYCKNESLLFLINSGFQSDIPKVELGMGLY